MALTDSAIRHFIGLREGSRVLGQDDMINAIVLPKGLSVLQESQRARLWVLSDDGLRNQVHARLDSARSALQYALAQSCKEDTKWFGDAQQDDAASFLMNHGPETTFTNSVSSICTTVMPPTAPATAYGNSSGSSFMTPITSIPSIFNASHPLVYPDPALLSFNPYIPRPPHLEPHEEVCYYTPQSSHVDLNHVGAQYPSDLSEVPLEFPGERDLYPKGPPVAPVLRWAIRFRKWLGNGQHGMG
ncbi:hypothetical protein MKZ38_003492 [Zalerion maritima]|uniref:Uncharacterized protein n=1 Tax=Zalerion maritima TaxID=339359 RepID=A0AAD5RWX6_9PEZI|nr:hypothetical protein MKZ38_003492 [Zalerion maritima]